MNGNKKNKAQLISELEKSESGIMTKLVGYFTVERNVIGLSLLLGLLIWIIDAIIDPLFPHELSFIESLITKTTTHELYMRSFIVLCFLIFSIIISRILAKRKKTEIALEETNKSLHDLVYITSHDLQSPLVTIEGFASKLLEDYRDKLGKDVEHRLMRLKENAKKMHDLVLSLLDFSRLSTIKFPNESFDPVKIIKDIISGDLSLMLEQAEAVVNIEEMPDIFGDKQRIEGVFRRLILNSIKYGGKNIIVGFKNGVYFVKDDGIGIPESQLEKIFSPGERLKVINVEGTGMGLTFCRNVINKHNGKIWVESKEKNKGSTFYFTIEKHRR